MPGAIRVGIGGWTYEPWRETFYPPDVPKARELQYASRKLTAIEINGTFYRLQKPDTYAKWRDDTPEGFMFSVKAPRYCTYRKVLGEAGDSIGRFIDSGVGELRDRLGPLLWQLEPRHKFEAEDLERFLGLLPKETAGRPLRHALEVRHESFGCEEFFDLARRHGVAVVSADTDEYPSFPEITADFVYWRLMRTQPELETGYTPAGLDEWAGKARAWAAGKPPRDVFLYFISGAKERAPGAAQALIERLGR